MSICDVAMEDWEVPVGDSLHILHLYHLYGKLAIEKECSNTASACPTPQNHRHHPMEDATHYCQTIRQQISANCKSSQQNGEFYGRLHPVF
jgi:hypothetical protein